MSPCKRPRQGRHSKGGRKPRSRKRASNFDQMRPVWSFAIADKEGVESLYSDRSCREWCSTILAKLRDFESMTWADIKRQTNRAGKTRNHYVATRNLTRSARERLEKLKQDDVERLFSLRLSSRIRIYGIVDGHILKIIWYDPEHRLYPSKPK